MKINTQIFKMYIFLFIFMFLISSDLYAQEKWGLKKTIERAFAVSNTIKAAEENINVQRANLEQVKKWPNPAIEVESSNKLGKEDGKDDYNYTSVALTQPLPIFRLPSQKAHASEIFLREEVNLWREKLKFEYDVAQDYHELQFKKEILEIAQQKLNLVKKKLNDKRTNGGIVRFLTPLDKSRLEIIKHNALLEVEKAEGEYLEDLAHLKIKLHLSEKESFDFDPLGIFSETPEFENLVLRQKQHPVVVSLQHGIRASEQSIKLVKMQRFEDPELRLFTERDIFANQREDFYGAALAIKLPVWDRKTGEMKKKKANFNKISYDLKAAEVELKGKLTKSYQHFVHLQKLEKNYQHSVEETKNFLDLTVKGFSAGETSILSLIDAYDTYYDNQLKYLEILKDLWLEYAEIRFLANISVVNININDMKYGGK